jgi:hypothetical protein
LAGGWVAAVVLGTALRAIGRGFGNGTFAVAEAPNADNPTASAKPAIRPVRHGMTDGEANGVTALLRGESSNRHLQVYFIEVVDKILNLP